MQDLENTLEYWKEKFNKLISFLHNKLHSWYDKDDKYIDVVNNMYNDNILDDDNIEELDLSKEKDDFFLLFTHWSSSSLSTNTK